MDISKVGYYSGRLFPIWVITNNTTMNISFLLVCLSDQSFLLGLSSKVELLDNGKTDTC